VEWKLDGARLQIHRSGSDVGLFTRTLDDVTARLPEIVDYVSGLPARDFVADGEAIALTKGGRPLPFQVTASRVGSRDPAAGQARTPLTLFLFDALHVDGVDLLDEPTAERHRILSDVVPAANRPDRIVTADPDEASQFLSTTLDRGHEGVMVKSLTAPYEAGRRGSGWLKVKPVHTLDLVVLAVEWGSGRRRGWLSNIHLGARDPVTGGFVMLGKTFKGMTDEMLAWQTERFLQLASGPTDGWVVPLRPEQVVEIAFDGVQRSSRYPGGLALRFARVLRYRDDKRPEEADTIDAVRAFSAQ
jgi:DNA ligase-1